MTGNESEKKERCPAGNDEMAQLTRGCSVEGHSAEQMSRQSLSSLESLCNWDDAQAAEARVGPSSRVRMWVWMISGCKDDIFGSPP